MKNLKGLGKKYSQSVLQLPVQTEENHIKAQVSWSQRTDPNPESLKQDAIIIY